MYSKAFMKFLFEYQKDDLKKDEEPKKIKLKSGGNGKLAEVFVTNDKS